jgi:hypothetical protein
VVVRKLAITEEDKGNLEEILGRRWTGRGRRSSRAGRRGGVGRGWWRQAVTAGRAATTSYSHEEDKYGRGEKISVCVGTVGRDPFAMRCRSQRACEHVKRQIRGNLLKGMKG